MTPDEFTSNTNASIGGPSVGSQSRGQESKSGENPQSKPEGNPQSESGENVYSKTERWSRLETPTPRYMTDSDKRIFAFRRYHGLGPDGRKMEEWTQQEIADSLGVSRQSVDRWLNREPMPGVESLKLRECMTLYAIASQGDTELLNEYLLLRDLEEKGEPSPLADLAREVNESMPGPHLFDGLDNELW